VKNILEVKNLSAGYGEIQVVRKVSLNVPDNDIVGIIGPNGAGKSTIAKAIVGIVPISEGEVIFNGERINGLKPHEIIKKGIILISSEPSIFPKMTVRENLILGGQLYKNKIEDNLKNVFRIFPILEERKDQRAETLSGGERQMLLIARGLMTNPRLIIADEISAGLAPQFARFTYQMLSEIAKNGVSVLVIEQYVQRALDISNTIYVLENGSIVLEGPSHEVAKHPKISEVYLGLGGY